jgi:hypothetical protein
MEGLQYEGGWVYQRDIGETVGWFVGHALPDAAEGWQARSWRIAESGRLGGADAWWLIEVDIPTPVKGMDCWLSFRLVEPADVVRDASSPYVLPMPS